MISTIEIRDAENAKGLEYTKADVYIDGKKVDSILVAGLLREGMELESEAISRALEGRRVVNISFSGNMVTVTTEPE